MGPKPRNLICGISEGILGYLLYQSRCGISEAYSEYLLYDPIVRVSKDKNWTVQSEFAVGQKQGKGDKNRIDFLCTSNFDENLKVGFEVKYLKSSNSRISVNKDKIKILELKKDVIHTKFLGFILIAGNHSESNIKKIKKISKELDLPQYHFVSFDNQFKKRYAVTVLKVI